MSSIEDYDGANEEYVNLNDEYVNLNQEDRDVIQEAIDKLNALETMLWRWLNIDETEEAYRKLEEDTYALLEPQE